MCVCVYMCVCVCMYVYMYVCMYVCMYLFIYLFIMYLFCVQFVESVLSFQHVGPGDQIRVIGLGGKHIYLPKEPFFWLSIINL